MAAFAHHLFNSNPPTFIVIGTLMMIFVLTIILIILIGFYLYHGIKGLTVDTGLNGSVKFPPAELKLKDLIIILTVISVDVAILTNAFSTVAQGKFNSFDLFQLSLAFAALSIVLAGLYQLFREHKIWKNTDQL